VVYPGHGPTTTLGEERRANPFFKSARELERYLGW
jgi:glyoxylase-like metal-dependent hydrolase (beta-lactamase superfamily II)